MAAKNSVGFKCTQCAYSTPRWLGCCPSCNEWNSFSEEKESVNFSNFGSKTKNNSSKHQTLTSLQTLDSIVTTDKERIISGINEWDTVLGGGIMPGSLIVLTGDPGIGKSTLLLHVANQLAQNYKTFYFSSEESLEQVKSRAVRITAMDNKLLFSDQATIESILYTCQTEKPDVVVIDSIQNCFFSETHSFPGTIAQLRETSFALMRLAKENRIAIIITCHITKDGVMAGPKTLEHMVDGVFYLQCEDRWNTRILRSIKNRFGTINELGFFNMTADGMEEVSHINTYLIDESSDAPGSVLMSTLEGSRPLLLEVQALVIPTKFGIPQRVITGLDHKRVVLIAAIIEKYLHIKLSSHDIFVKISGGLKMLESSSDLAIALALLSSYFQQPLPPKTIALGEISLTGAIKPVRSADVSLKEAQKFGIKTVLISFNQNGQYPEAVRLKNVYQLLSFFSSTETSS